METLYDILKVREDAPPEVIKAAHKALSSMHHPDKHQGDPAATKFMQKVNRAYYTLRDPALRAQYDDSLRKIREQEQHQNTGPHTADMPPPPGNPPSSATPEDEGAQPSALSPKPRRWIDWRFWGTIIASALAAKVIGALPAFIALMVFYWVQSKRGVVAALVASCLVGAATLAIISTALHGQIQSMGPQSAAVVAAATGGVATPEIREAAVASIDPAQRSPAAPSQPAQTQPQRTSLDDELAAMDQLHPGWRQKIRTQDFQQWLAAQGEQARFIFENANKAHELAKVVHQYDQDVIRRHAAATLAAKKEENRRASAEYKLSDVPGNVPNEQLPYIRRAASALVKQYPILNTPHGQKALEQIILERNKRIFNGDNAEQALIDATHIYAPFYQ